MSKNFWLFSMIVAVFFMTGCVGRPQLNVELDNGKEEMRTSSLFTKDVTASMDMVFVKGGCYQMGDVIDGDYGYYTNEDELPVHEVWVHDFYRGIYEVTLGQWKEIMGSTNTREYMEQWHFKDDQPMSEISWNDAQEFIKKLNSKGGGGKFRLPTEAEWEYACRDGGKKERYCGGDDLDALAWHSRNAVFKKPVGLLLTKPVGLKKPNILGLYDMQGNVWEWTSDWYAADYYNKSPRDNPKGPDAGDRRSIRGACVSGEPEGMRPSRRSAYPADFRNNHVGFRIVRDP